MSVDLDSTKLTVAVAFLAVGRFTVLTDSYRFDGFSGSGNDALLTRFYLWDGWYSGE